MEDWLSSPGLRPPKKDDTQAKLNDADEQIAMAHRHVDRGRLIIERQRAIVARWMGLGSRSSRMLRDNTAHFRDGFGQSAQEEVRPPQLAISFI
jgi:hypothetical protein